MVYEVGAYLLAERLQIGVSILELPIGEVDLEQYTFTQEPSIALTASYSVPLTRNLELKPMTLVKYSGDQLQTDIAALVYFDEKYFVGATWRGYDSNSIDAMAIQLGAQATNKLSFAYSYDLAMSELSSAHAGSHEIGVIYKLDRVVGKGKLPPVIFNPRLKTE